jgi:hypothetical protein
VSTNEMVETVRRFVRCSLPVAPRILPPNCESVQVANGVEGCQEQIQRPDDVHAALPNR